LYVDGILRRGCEHRETRRLLEELMRSANLAFAIVFAVVAIFYAAEAVAQKHTAPEEANWIGGAVQVETPWLT
jgi:hypothetical protein